MEVIAFGGDFIENLTQLLIKCSSFVNYKAYTLLFTVSQGPPVGNYNVNNRAKNGGAIVFPKSRRFGESKGKLIC